MFLLLAACSVPVSDFEILAGFHFEWDAESHRVSRIAVAVGGENGPLMAMAGKAADESSSGDDFLNYRLPTLEVRNARAALGQVRVPILLPAGMEAVDEDAEDPDEDAEEAWNGTARIPLDQVGGWPVYTAVIQGFGVRSDGAQNDTLQGGYDAAMGYALGRLAVQLGDAERGDSEIIVPVSFQFIPADTGETTSDHPAMNASIPFVQFEAWVEVGVVGHMRQGTQFPVNAMGTHVYEPPHSEQPPILLDLGFGDGRLAFWQSLSFEANPEGEGEPIRRFGSELVGEERVAGAQLDFGNSSTTERNAFTYVIQGQLGLIDLGGDAHIYLRNRKGKAEPGDWVP
jgi:hypothetical protein